MSISRTRACWAVVLCMSCALATRAAAQDTTFQPTFNVHGFLQIYYRAGDPLTRDGFRLRKSDLKFSGDVSPRLKWRVTFDAGKALGIDTKAVEVADSTAISEAAIDQKSKLLQDAALTYIVNKDFSIDVGQQVLPMTLEGKMSASQIETIERNLFTSERSRAIGLGDTRDIGVSANGFAFNTIEYHAGVFNEAGESAGTLDPNQQKTFMGRVAIHPSFLPALQIGGTAGGRFSDAAAAPRSSIASRSSRFAPNRCRHATAIFAASGGTASAPCGRPTGSSSRRALIRGTAI